MTFPATNLNEAVGLLVPDSNAFSEVINGDVNETVLLPRGGVVPTLKMALDSLRVVGESLGEWQAGVTEFTSYTQYATYNGLNWRPKFSTPLPYTAQQSDPSSLPDADFVEIFLNVTDPSVKFTDVESMISGVDITGKPIDYGKLASIGAVVETIVNNTFTNQGGAEYKVIPVADYTRNLIKPYNGTNYIGADYLDSTGHYVFQRVDDVSASDKSFGVIGTVDTALGVVDDAPALDAMIEYCRIGKALGGKLTGGTKPEFTPRSQWWISYYPDMIDFRVDIDFGSSEFRPIDETVEAMAVETAGNGWCGLQFWYDHLDPEQLLLNQNAAVEFSKDQPVAVTSESPFSKWSRIWIYNAYQGFRLYSQGTDGGLIWQNRFEQCLTWNTLDYGFYLWSVAQTSTTTTLSHTHTKNVTRSAVQHGGKVFRALQHMLSDNPIEPEVTVGWEDYWLQGFLPNGDPEVPSTQPEWASGTFYRTCGKGYFINNITTIVLDNASADGGTNFEEGNVLYVLNSHVSCNSFHLEGTNLNFADKAPIILNSDMDWGWVLLYDLRVQMQDINDRCPLFGGNMGRERAGKLSGIRNQAQNARKVGSLDVARLRSTAGQDFIRFEAGIGVNDLEITGKDTCRVFTSARKNSKTADLEFAMASSTNYYKVYEAIIPDIDEAEATFQEFSDIVEITSNAGNTTIDQVGQYAKVRVSAFVQSGPATTNRSFFDAALISGDSEYIYSTFDETSRVLQLWVKCKNNGQMTITNFKGRSGGYDVHTGKQRLLYEAIEVAATTVEAMENFAEVAKAAGSGEWVEWLPNGFYGAGNYTLPNSATLSQVKSFRLHKGTTDPSRTISGFEQYDVELLELNQDNLTLELQVTETSFLQMRFGSGGASTSGNVTVYGSGAIIIRAEVML